MDAPVSLSEYLEKLIEGEVKPDKDLSKALLIKQKGLPVMTVSGHEPGVRGDISVVLHLPSANDDSRVISHSSGDMKGGRTSRPHWIHLCSEEVDIFGGATHLRFVTDVYHVPGKDFKISLGKQMSDWLYRISYQEQDVEVDLRKKITWMRLHQSGLHVEIGERFEWTEESPLQTFVRLFTRGDGSYGLAMARWAMRLMKEKKDQYNDDDVAFIVYATWLKDWPEYWQVSHGDFEKAIYGDASLVPNEWVLRDGRLKKAHRGESFGLTKGIEVEGQLEDYAADGALFHVNISHFVQ